MKIIKKGLKGLLIIFGIMIALCLIMMPFDLKHQAEIRKLTINEVDLSKLEDGQYKGEFNQYRWLYNATIDIKNHKITNIELTENLNVVGGYGKELINRVIKEQKIKVDTVAGATISSKAILKSIEDALD